MCSTRCCYYEKPSSCHFLINLSGSLSFISWLLSNRPQKWLCSPLPWYLIRRKLWLLPWKPSHCLCGPWKDLPGSFKLELTGGGSQALTWLHILQVPWLTAPKMQVTPFAVDFDAFISWGWHLGGHLIRTELSYTVASQALRLQRAENHSGHHLKYVTGYTVRWHGTYWTGSCSRTFLGPSAIPGITGSFLSPLGFCSSLSSTSVPGCVFQPLASLSWILSSRPWRKPSWLLCCDHNSFWENHS